MKLAFLVPIQANPYTEAQVDGVEEAASKGDATVQIGNANFSPQAQGSQCQDAVSGKTADAIIIAPVIGSSVVPCAERAAQEGIPVVALDSPIGPRFDTAEAQVEGQAGAVVQTTNVEPVVVAEELIAACEDKDPCNVGRMLGVAGFSYDSERSKVIKAAIEDHPNIHVVQEVVYGYDPRKALTTAQEMFTAHPDINVVESNGGQGGLVAAAVAKQMGLDVTVIANSGSKEEIRAVKDGTLYATVATYPRDMGRRAGEIAIAAARDEPMPEKEAFVDARETFGPKELAITKNDAGQFEGQWSIGPLPTGSE